MSVVFSDLVGSTSLAERQYPESLAAILAEYFGAMRAVLEHHGGAVEKYIGDAIVAVFGVPVLHEDDALRAVRAALDMRAALDALNADLERRHGIRLQARTGVNTGEVAVGTPGHRRFLRAWSRGEHGRTAGAGRRAGGDPRR